MVEIQNVKKIQEINQRNAQSQNLKAVSRTVFRLCIMVSFRSMIILKINDFERTTKTHTHRNHQTFMRETNGTQIFNMTKIST